MGILWPPNFSNLITLAIHQPMTTPTKEPFFSVVIPVYNKGPHIQRSIGSVLSQTFQDFELILVNDASTDNSLEEMQKFTDPRIRILHRDEPGPGGYAARNLGIQEARAEWVALLDADDEWYPEHLEKMNKLSVLFPEVFIMSCGWETYDKGKKQKNSYYEYYKSAGRHIITLSSYLNDFLHKKGSICSSVVCLRKRSPIVNDVFPSQKKARRGGDIYAWLKIVCYHKKIAWSDHVGAIYFRDSVNMVTKKEPFSIILVDKQVFKKRSLKLELDEIKLLQKYMNMQMKHSWVGNLLDGNKNFNLRNNLYWKYDKLNYLYLCLLSFVPSFIIKLLVKSRIKFFLKSCFGKIIFRSR
jgi:glycosyltransferase involved in cell wall biosynthesis